MSSQEPAGSAGSTDDTAPKSARGSRVRLLVLAGATALAIVVGIALISGGGAQNRTSTAPSETPDGTSDVPSEPDPSITAPATDERLTDDGASTTVAALLDAVSVIGGDPQRSATTLGNIATGAILEEIEADSEELEANGWTRVGVPVVDRATVINSDASFATVEACVDSSDVEIRDAAGTPIPRDPAAARSLNLYTLVFDGSAWRVSARTFPNDAAC